MASFGHVAAGLLAARLHGGSRQGEGQPAGDGEGPKRRPRLTPWWSLLLFSGLALLPDADVVLVALGACDTGACGHRGASHSLPFAIAVGVVAAVIARRLRWPAVRTGIAAAFAVGSHAMLDLLGEGGRGLPLLWPFSDERFASPIRLFPDAPRGLALLTWPGVVNIVTELVVFSPLVIYALWPRVARRFSTRAPAAPVAQQPESPQLPVEGAAGTEGAAALDRASTGLTPVVSVTPTATSDEGAPSVRSAG